MKGGGSWGGGVDAILCSFRNKSFSVFCTFHVYDLFFTCVTLCCFPVTMATLDSLLVKEIGVTS